MARIFKHPNISANPKKLGHHPNINWVVVLLMYLAVFGVLALLAS